MFPAIFFFNRFALFLVLEISSVLLPHNVSGNFFLQQVCTLPRLGDLLCPSSPQCFRQFFSSTGLHSSSSWRSPLSFFPTMFPAIFFFNRFALFLVLEISLLSQISLGILMMVPRSADARQF